MEKVFIISTDKNYNETMMAIYELMNKGESSLTPEEIEQLGIMAIAAERYEGEILHLKQVK